jgi:hypothetical protein
MTLLPGDPDFVSLKLRFVPGRAFHSSTSQAQPELFIITDALPPPSVSHKKCSRQSGKWTGVCPWSRAW